MEIVRSRRGQPAAGAGSTATDQRTVRAYRFGRPDRLSGDQLAPLSVVHESFARRAGEALAAHLRAPFKIQLTSVQQPSWGESLRALPRFGTLAVVEMEPLAGLLLLALDPPLSFALIDRLLGGRGDPDIPTRALSEIERSVIENIVRRLLLHLRAAWGTIAEVRPRLRRIEPDPQRLRIAAAADPVVQLGFAVRVREVCGTMGLCLPGAALAPVRRRLGRRVEEDVAAARLPASTGAHPGERAALHARLQQAPVAVTVEVGGASLPLQAIAALTAGDVLRLDRTGPIDQMAVKVGGRTTFLGRPGVVGGRVAVQIRELAAEADAARE